MINHLWHAWVILEENNCCNCLFALSLKFNRLKSKVMRSQDSLKFSDKKEATINKIRSLVCKLSSTPEKLGWCRQPRKWKMLNCSSMPCRKSRTRFNKISHAQEMPRMWLVIQQIICSFPKSSTVTTYCLLLI